MPKCRLCGATLLRWGWYEAANDPVEEGVWRMRCVYIDEKEEGMYEKMGSLQARSDLVLSGLIQHLNDKSLRLIAYSKGIAVLQGKSGAKYNVVHEDLGLKTLEFNGKYKTVFRDKFGVPDELFD